MFVTNPNSTGSAAYFNTDNPNYATVVIEQDDANGTALQVSGNTITDGTAIFTNSDVNFSGTLLSAQIAEQNDGVAAIFSSNNLNSADATVTIEQAGAGIALRTTGDVEVTGEVEATEFKGNIDWSYVQNKPTSLPPSGAAGGDLTGIYPNPTIANNAVTNAKIADNAVTNSKIADNAVSTAKIQDNAVTDAKIQSVSWGKVTGAPAFITSVSTNSTLTGDGTTGDPLGINLNNENLWTAQQSINANVVNGFALFVTNPNATGSAAYFNTNNPNYASVVIEQDDANGTALQVLGNTITDGTAIITNSKTNFSGTLLSAQIANANDGVAAIFSSNNTNVLDATVTIEQQGTGIALRTVGDVDVTGDVTANEFKGNLDWSYVQNAPGFLTSESDPVFGSSAASGITTSDITNWNTAYGWGNHATAGYLTSVTTNSTLTGDGTTGNLLGINLSNQNSWLARQAINANVPDDYAFFVTNPATDGSAAQFTVNSNNPSVVIENQGTGNSLEAIGNVYVEGDLAISDGTYSGTFQLDALTDDRTYTLPDTSGTIILNTTLPAETDPVWN
ncbi:MAG TPA: hypothetical protein PLU67_03810, partial [Candidatus Kapabacteria bacterium]|nr:hypothetical protein [Candidatus Kapabacteria bacterium]